MRFDFGQQMLNITRSTVYITARYHPSGKAGWLTKPHPKNGDWRRFTISKQMCQAVQEHIEEYGLGPDDLLFPQWMFAYVRSTPVVADDDENLPPLVSKTGVVHEHGTMGARYAMNCHCAKCKAYAADYQRQWRREQSAQRASKGELPRPTPGAAMEANSSWPTSGHASGTRRETRPDCPRASLPTTPANGDQLGDRQGSGPAEGPSARRTRQPRGDVPVCRDPR